MNGLAERNERLFFKVLAIDIENLMPIVYTPTVGLACQKFSLVFQHPKGLYITIKDKGHIYSVLKVNTFFSYNLFFKYKKNFLITELARTRCTSYSRY